MFFNLNLKKKQICSNCEKLAAAYLRKIISFLPFIRKGEGLSW
jgi:hypothetical protein